MSSRLFTSVLEANTINVGLCLDTSLFPVQPSKHFVDMEEEQDDPNIPMRQCCCGTITCLFWRDTQAEFDRLDKTIETAGKIGQVRELFLFLLFYFYITIDRFVALSCW